MKIIGAAVIGIVGLALGTVGLVSESTNLEKSKLPVSRVQSATFTAMKPDLSSSHESFEKDDAEQGTVCTSNLKRKIALLEQGIAFLESTHDYTATMQKQEVVGSELLEPQTMSLKCRHQPFSVYLKWTAGDVGREVLYVEGKNKGRLIGHDGGWRANIPAFYLSPDGSLAMADARVPVTKAGILNLAKIMLDIHHEDLTKSNVQSCEVSTQESFDGRPCIRFTTLYKSPKESATYRKSITWIDREWKVPVHSVHFEWPKSASSPNDQELDDATLIESYSFTDVQLECHLTDADFDRKNPEYHFR